MMAKDSLYEWYPTLETPRQTSYGPISASGAGFTCHAWHCWQSHQVMLLSSTGLCFYCRLTHDYPEQAAAISIKNVHGLSVSDKRKLSKALHCLADEHAAREEVCAFNLIEACQVGLPIATFPHLIPLLRALQDACIRPATLSQFALHTRGRSMLVKSASCMQEQLRAWNKPSKEKDNEEEAGGASLWHQMARRLDASDSEASADESAAGRDIFARQAAWADAGGAGAALFDEPGQPGKAGPWHMPAVALPPADAAAGGASNGPAEDEPPASAAAAAGARLGLLSKEGAAPATAENAAEACTDEGGAGKSGTSVQPGRVPREATIGERLLSRSARALRLSGSGERSSGGMNEPSSSMVGNLLSSVRSGISAFGRVVASLPPYLRRSLRDGSAGEDIFRHFPWHVH